MDLNALIAALVAFLLNLLGLAPPPVAAVAQLDHAFVIVLENTNYSDVFGAKAGEAPYLNGLANAHVRNDAYYGISHVSLGNYIGMVSGQVPGVLDHADCPVYTVCKRNGPTIAAQLDGVGKTWKAYMQSMPAPCTFPADVDNYQNGYATRHNPFVYFNEIVGNLPYCQAHDVPYVPNFAADLGGAPPNFSFIVPDTCDDGHDSNCNGTGRTPIQNLDVWLAANVPPIQQYMANHPAEKSAIFITFDEAANTDTAGCCNQPPLGTGGGHIGFVMVGSTGLEKAPGYHSLVPANHYSLLRTLEAAFGLAPLGEAAKVSPMSDLFAP